jgi:uncharacterized protein (DUF3084 family)
VGDLTAIDIIGMDYDEKVKLLERVTQEMLDLRMEFARVSGRFAELRANLQVLKEVKSALQSAIKAEGPM